MNYYMVSIHEQYIRVQANKASEALQIAKTDYNKPPLCRTEDWKDLMGYVQVWNVEQIG